MEGFAHFTTVNVLLCYRRTSGRVFTYCSIFTYSYFSSFDCFFFAKSS